MKKLSIPLVVTVLFAIVLGVTVGSKNDDPAVDAEPQAVQPAIPLGAPMVTEQPTDPCTYAEQSAPADSAEQILTDMNDANVEERTGELMAAFNRLGKLCDEALKTADAMLSADFDSRPTSDASGRKGAENGE